MGDQHRNDYVDDYRPQGGRGWPERTRDEMRTWSGDTDARMWQQDDRDNRPQYGDDRGWRDQGHGRYGPAAGHDRLGGDWRTSGSSGRDQGHRGGASWGRAGSYGRSQGAGSFGGSRSWPDGDGAGGYNSGAGPDWDTAGGHGGGTSFVEPRSYGGSAMGGHGVWENYAGRGPKGYRRSDDRIREDVSDRLEQDHGVDASDISVQVLDGEVTLTGTVSTRYQKRRAEDCVEMVSGVKEVTNSLRVNRQNQHQPPPSETSSSILGLGGQQSRESSSGTTGNGNVSPKEDAATRSTTSSPGTPGFRPGLSA